MAWPFSRYQTFVANTTRIGAAFLNAVQDQLVAIATGTATTKAAVTTWTLLWTWDDSTAGAQRRLYMGPSGIAITHNAEWVEADLLWYSDDNAAVGSIYEFSFSQIIARTHVAAVSWADGAWTLTFGLLNQPSGAAQIGTTGQVDAVGDISTSSGNLRAYGTPVGSTGPGLLKAARVYALGTTVTSGQVAPGGGFGATAAPTMFANAKDFAGGVTITTGGGGYTADPTFVFTFKDGTFTNTPTAFVWLQATNDGTITPGNATCGWTVTATTLTVTLYTNGTAPSATKTFDFGWILIGH